MTRNAKTRLYSLGAIAMLTLAMTVGCSSAPRTSADESKAQAATTLDNLQSAYQDECNARSMYTAFSYKAFGEGYDQVASLFRAAAQAEDIHAKNLAEAIKKMGATPTAKVKPAPVGDTAANLKVAVDSETYDRDTMYPQFAEQARAENLPVALRAFTLARDAEAQHATLFTDTLANVDQYKKKGTRAFYVCPACGFTTADPKVAKCPTCTTPKQSFVPVG